MTRHGLTPVQRKTMTFIESFEAEKGFAPSFEEIADAMGLKAKSNVHRIVHQLIDRGAIAMMPARARSITILRRAA